jgi:hypothetical protein
MVDQPVLDLVGCYAYSSEKVGRDVILDISGSPDP